MNLFTVEQLELVRRLKTSGLPADKIIEAYRSLDQIENELKLVQVKREETEQKTSSPVISAFSQPSQLQTSPPAALAADQLSSPIVRQLNTQGIQQFAQVSRCALTTVPESCLYGASVISSSLPTSLPQPSPGCQSTPGLASSASATTSHPAQSVFTAEHFRFPAPAQMCSTNSVVSQSAPVSTQFPTGISSATSSTNSNVCRPLRPTQQQPRSTTTGQRLEIQLDNPNEVEEFMQQGEEFCINEMKKFITQYSLRQTTVAQMTGVSQPYISKLLNGNHRELSLRCRRNIYSWYLNCRRHPAIYCQDPSTRLETNGDGELLPQRRERYVFRPILIRILESYFVDSPFPDSQKRAEISQACNSALQAEKKGTHLMPKEVVTPQVIANWFANKRKEMRRKSNEENRPRNLATGGTQFSDLASTPSPSGSSTANAESPITTMLPNGLLVPMYQPNPLSMLLQQQQTQPISVENFLEARPNILNAIPQPQAPNLTNLFFNKQPLLPTSVESQQLNAIQFQTFFNSQLALPTQTDQVEPQTSEVVQPENQEQNVEENRNLPPPPVLCREDAEDKSPKPLKMEDEKDGSEGQMTQNPTAYADLLQKLLDSGMLGMLQQQMNPSSMITSNIE